MKNKYLISILIILIVGFVVSLFFVGGFFTGARNSLIDKLFLDREPNADIVILAIDNKSLNKIGRWPWDRKIHADIIRKISAHKPSVIGFDVSFPEVSDIKSDQELAEALQTADNVILPREADISLVDGVFTAKTVLDSVKNIKDGAYDVGITNTPPDADGVFRRVPVWINNGDEENYIFAYKIVDKYLRDQQKKLPNIKMDNYHRLVVNYYGGLNTVKTYSVIDFLEGKISDINLTNKIVLIGATAPDFHDEQLVPTSKRRLMSGIEIHANIVGTIIDSRFLQPINVWFQVLIFIILAFLVSLLMTRFRVVIGTFLVFLIFIIYFVIDLVVFDYGYILDILFAILTVLFSYVAIVLWKYFVELREKKQIKNTFSHYVSPDVIKDILDNPEKLKLGGEKKELSIFFSDIRGFTSVSESMTPEALVNLLNEYLTAMTDIVMESQGVVDKYMGDAVMAFWGAPFLLNNHAQIACRAALAMGKKVAEKNPVWLAKYGHEIRIGMGLNTGKVVIGNMGSNKRFDYTIMGDAVNLASRLESATKQYGVSIIISQTTKQNLNDDFVVRYLDKVAVKGKKEGVEIFELVDLKSNLDDSKNFLLNNFSQAINLYRERKWDQARNIFENIFQKYKDIPSKIYIDRCNDFKDNPPLADWDGVFRMTDK